MDPRVNARQLEVLQWVGDGCPDGRWPEGSTSHKTTAVALQNRRLVRIRKGTAIAKRWECTLTDAGKHYLEHGDYPPGHVWSRVTMKPVHEEPKPRGRPPSKRQTPPLTDGEPRTGPASKPQPPTWEIDSPNGHAARDRKRSPAQAGEQPGEPDPWGDRILVSVKEAAWLLSLPECAIRTAVRDEDIHRVFIGKGTTHYRIVYQSLLAWVNAMPRTSGNERRWSRW